MSGTNQSMFIYRPLLTNMSVRRGLGESGIGLSLAPRVNSSGVTGVYLQRDRQRVGSVNPKRAAGEFVKRTNSSRGQLKSFLTVDRSIIKQVPFELVEGQTENELFGELENAAGEALSEIQHAHELDVNTALWGSDQATFEAIYGSGSQVATPSTKFDAAGADIRQPVVSLMDTVYKRCGYYPNRLTMTKAVINTLASDPNNEIGERMKYTAGRVPTEELLAQYFGVGQVIIPKNLTDSANAGQTESYDFMWTGNHILAAYVDDRQTRNKNTLASTFVWDPARKPFLGVFTRYNEDNESWEAKVSAYYDVETVDIACGGVLYNVFAP